MTHFNLFFLIVLAKFWIIKITSAKAFKLFLIHSAEHHISLRHKIALNLRLKFVPGITQPFYFHATFYALLSFGLILSDAVCVNDHHENCK